MNGALGTHQNGSLSTNVLLVDDEVAWTEVVRDRIEQRTTNFNITTAGGAVEAQSVLSSTAIDCIVCDYQMPKINGIEFLNRLQEKSEPPPFILLTGHGSETVASEAILQGVSDYVQKDEVAGQPATLINRIENAVEKYRLQKRLKKQRKQYQSIAQQTIEAICITEDSQIVFTNDTFVEMVGTTREAAIGTRISDVVDIDTDWITSGQNKGNTQIQQVTLQTVDSSERIFELKYKHTQIAGTDSTFWSFRDITELKTSKERLEYERDLSQIIIEILAQSSTADTLELSFCDKITNYEPFSFAWVGEPARGSELSVRAYTGTESEYLSQIEPALSETDESLSAPPSLWAFRKQEPQFLSDISSLPETRWQQAAVAQGFESVATFPLITDDLCYGVLCVYATDAAAVDTALKQLLKRLSHALAKALADRKNAAALMSDKVTEIRFKITGTDFYLNEVLRDEPLNESQVKISLESVIQQSDQRYVEILHVNEGDADTIENALRDNNRVDTVVTSSSEVATTLRVETDELTLAGRLKQLGVRVREIVVNDGVAEVTVQLPVERDQRMILNQLEREYNIETVVSHTTRDIQTQDTTQPRLNLSEVDLTEKQAQAIKTAYQANYFSKPRENSAREVADILDISHTTFLQHLRAAQQEIFEIMYGK